MGTGIEWTDETWNPTVGCTHVSAGCDNCYAAREASGRLAQTPTYRGLAVGGKFTGEVRLLPDRLDKPIRWQTPRMVFVNSMSDLFHAGIPDEYIADVFAVMALTRRHTYQVLTKRHARMRTLLRDPAFREEIAVRATLRLSNWPDRLRRQMDVTGWTPSDREGPDRKIDNFWTVSAGTQWAPPWPLPNVWGGVSVEDQHWAGIRIPALIDTPLAVRFLSCEPLLGGIDLIGPGDGCENAGPAISHTPVSNRTDYGTGVEYDCDHQVGVDWVIAGGESGPNARPMHPEWARHLRDQCADAGVPFLFKQWGEYRPVTEVGEPYSVNLRRDGQPGERDDPGVACMARVGKKAAGRELDGVLHDGYPARELVTA